tara:strand:- start:256 stop:2469 length:2214 start_codon:yes stop_codon:yes gene_type:complete
MKGFSDLYKSEKDKIKKNKFSSEQIIHQAIQLHLKGNISEAAKHYQKLISQGCNDKRVFSNYGVILQGIGKLKEAEILYRKAIELNPDFADAYSNLGTVLNDLGKLQEAEFSYRKAIELNPGFVNAYSNQGNILRDLGKLQEAEFSYRKAIELSPDFADAHCNLGNILSDLGKLQEAELSTRKATELNPNFAEAHLNLGIIFSGLGKSQEAFDSYLKSIEINPTLSYIYPIITRFLEETDPSQLNKSKLQVILYILFERNDVPHNELSKAFNFLYGNLIESNLESLDLDPSKTELIFNDQVIINALKKITFNYKRLEKGLTNARKYLCNKITKNKEKISYSELALIIALGKQCFLNEYVYSFTKEEKISLKAIIKKSQDNGLSELNISILSCYFPLYKLLDQLPSLISFNSSNQSFQELIALQITEPLKEIELSKNIKKLGSINDDVSQKVKSQYEENPYPRWRYGNHSESKKISIVQAINNEIKPKYISKTICKDQLNVLIAGCGTGSQILHAQRYKNAQITAIDLSLSSLSYAQRKINELGIDNVELIQMDILEIALLEMKFDIIECSGVLHHMNNPLRGLKVLLKVLKKTGFLKLGLYSELARKDIIEARKYIATENLQPNDEAIRNFREDVFSGKIEGISNLSDWGDFYTMSECRDLCFHSHEHRFTIKKLEETLKYCKLKFLGFLLPKTIKSLYGNYYPEDNTQTNLKNWARFEERHPNTFGGMYQFWVSNF